MEKQYTVENVSEMINTTINKNKMVVYSDNGVQISFANLILNTIFNLITYKGDVDNIIEKLSQDGIKVTEDSLSEEGFIMQDITDFSHKAYDDYTSLIEKLVTIDKEILIQCIKSIHSVRYLINQSYGSSNVPGEVAGIISAILDQADCKTVLYYAAEDVSICRSFSSRNVLKYMAKYAPSDELFGKSFDDYLENSGIKMISVPRPYEIEEEYVPFIEDKFEAGYKTETSVDANVRIYHEYYDDFHDEDFERCINFSLKPDKVLKKAIIVLPTSWLKCQQIKNDSDVDETVSILRTLEKLYSGRYIESIIELPDDTVLQGISHSILVLNTQGGCSNIRFINASECIIRDIKDFVVDARKIIENLYSDSSSSDIMMTYKYWDNKAYAYFLVPHIWAPICSNKQSRYLISDLVDVYSKESYDIVKEQGINNPTLKPENVLSFYYTHDQFYDVIVDSHKTSHYGEYDKYKEAVKTRTSYKVEKLEPGSIVVEDNLDCSLRFYKKGDACYISTGIAFHTNEKLVTPEYLIYILMDMTMDMPFRSGIPGSTSVEDKYKLFLSVPVVVYDSISTQIALVESALKQEFDERLKALSADQDRFSIRSAAADIQHMLGTPFSQQQVCMELIKRSKDDAAYKKNVAALIDISEYIQRVVTSVGADISSAEFNPVDVKLPDLVNQYIASYGNYSTGYFRVSYASGNVSEGVANVDVDMIKLQLDTIMDNAGRHGFGKKSDASNQVQVRLDYFKYKDLPYYRLSVMNNGKPKNPDYSVRDFISRGNFDGESGRTGLGGYHIHEIARKHNGFVGIDSTEEWGFIVNVLIPIKPESMISNVKYITDDKEYI